MKKTLSDVVVIEDDDDIRHLLELSLCTIGNYNVSTYSLAGCALKELQGNTLPDMILLDVMMPQMSGPEFIPLFKTIPGAEQVCIVMLTAKASQQELSDLLTSGAHFVAQKPFDPMLLPDLLRHYWQMHHASF